MNQKNLIIPLLLFVLSFGACNQPQKISLPPITVIEGEPKAVAFTKAGWREFELGNFSDAAESFRLALAEDNFYDDAYNGLGWSLSRMDSLKSAQNYLTIAIIATASSSQIKRDASAGRAFVNLALDEYNEAITDVWIVINRYSPEYTFRHDVSIDEQDILLVEAECRFLLGDYLRCYDTLKLIDATLDIDPNDPEQLAQIIEKLKNLK